MRPSVRPVGPLPASVYWKRRALVLLVILPVLWAVGAWLVPDDKPDASGSATSSGQSKASPAAWPSSGVVSPKPAASSRPSTKPKPKPKPSKSSKPRKPAKPLPPGQYAPCQGPAVSVAAGAKRQAVGKPLAIKVTYTNESAGTCQVAISPSTLRLTVISGTDRIWDTNDCQKLIPSAPLTLKKGQPRTITISWSGRRSSDGCPADSEVAKPGYYAVKLAVSGVAVNLARFRLT